MTKFKEFSEKFNETFDNVQEFIYKFEENENPLNAKLIESLEEDNSDSYGYTDDRYTRIFYFADFDIHVKFTGFYKSYHGEEWDNDFTEVKPVTKEITTYE